MGTSIILLPNICILVWTYRTSIPLSPDPPSNTNLPISTLHPLTILNPSPLIPTNAAFRILFMRYFVDNIPHCCSTYTRAGRWGEKFFVVVKTAPHVENVPWKAKRKGRWMAIRTEGDFLCFRAVRWLKRASWENCPIKRWILRKQMSSLKRIFQNRTHSLTTLL